MLIKSMELIMARQQKVIENFSDDKLESIKNKLMAASNNPDATATQIILKFKTEITKLRREKVSLSKICEILKSEDVEVSISMLRYVLGPLNKRKKDAEKMQIKVVKAQEKQEKKIDTVQKTVVTPAQGQEQKPLFKVPDLSTLPPELTSIPGFNPASAELVRFVDKNGTKMIYMKGRVISDPDQKTGPVNTFTLDKHKPLNNQ